MGCELEEGGVAWFSGVVDSGGDCFRLNNLFILCTKVGRREKRGGSAALAERLFD